MPLVPARFLIRLAYPCRYLLKMPAPAKDRLLDLGEEFRSDNFAAMDGERNFAELCLAWNEAGLGVQVEGDPKDEGWGITVMLVLPGDLRVMLYEPRHPVAIGKS